MEAQSNSEIIVFSPSRTARKVTQIISLFSSTFFATFSWVSFEYGPGGTDNLILGFGTAAVSLVSAVAAFTDIFLGHKIRICLGKDFLIVGGYGLDKHITLSEITNIAGSYDRITIVTPTQRVVIDDTHFSSPDEQNRFLTLLRTQCGK